MLRQTTLQTTLKSRWVRSPTKTLTPEGKKIIAENPTFINSVETQTDDLESAGGDYLDEMIRLFFNVSKTGKYVENAFKSLGENYILTTTGKQMKKLVPEDNRKSGKAFFNYLMAADEKTLRELFGRKFLAKKRPKRLSGYNLFVRDHGFKDAGVAWKGLAEGDRAAFNERARAIPLPQDASKKKKRRLNNWAKAVQQARAELEITGFEAVRKDTPLYARAMEIKNVLQEQASEQEANA